MTLTLTRRAAMIGAAVSAAAITVPAAGTVAALGGFKADPLVQAIKNYRDGCAAFCAMPEAVSDADAGEHTFYPPIIVLSDWTEAAKSRESAYEALKLVGEEVEFLSDMGAAMFDAALRYLAAEGGAA